MVTRTFLDKCTTIVEGSKNNFGLHPVASLHYGAMASRALIHFNLDNIVAAIESHGKENLRHYLKLTNCGNVQTQGLEKPDIMPGMIGYEYRATSFDVILFRIPEKWDAGVGFDKSDDFWLLGQSSVSNDGANWYQAYNGKKWGTGIDASGNPISTEGVLSRGFIKKQYDNFKKGLPSLIVAEQHFDKGNENFSFDITDYVNSLVHCTGITENNGLCLAMLQEVEDLDSKLSNYVGFFTNNTNTFFEPYVETRCLEGMKDDRYSFYSKKENKLYFYAFLGGFPIELDTLPICTINGVEYPVFKASTGFYYANVNLEAEDNTILYDEWSNLSYNGEEIDDIEMEFVVLPKKRRFLIGSTMEERKAVEPSLYGINDNEKLNQGEVRMVNCQFRIPYSTNTERVNSAFYRLYVKDGKREVDVIDWDFIELCGDNWFLINTAELVPGEYHIDIKGKFGMETRIFKDKLVFTVVDNITEIKK